jgi:hypothetical protein
MSDYPRERNGWVDDGKLITATNRRDTCPNCGSRNYRETISMEKCDDCGLCCDYWGTQTNDVYRAYERRYHAAEEAERERRQRQWEIDNGYRDEDDYS